MKETLTNIYNIVSNFIEAHPIFSCICFAAFAMYLILTYCWIYHRDSIVQDWDEYWMD